MAFQKSVTLPNTTVGDYHRLDGFRYDAVANELQVKFGLYVDSTEAAAGAAPIKEEFARMRIGGTQFIALCHKSALATGAAAGKDIIQLLYEAAKAICGGNHTTGIVNPLSYVKNDESPDFYWDATDV